MRRAGSGNAVGIGALRGCAQVGALLQVAAQVGEARFVDIARHHLAQLALRPGGVAKLDSQCQNVRLPSVTGFSVTVAT